MKIRCSKCGYENYFTGLEDEEAMFCSNCNTPLDKPIKNDGVILNTNNHNRKSICDTYNKAEEVANKTWEKVKKAVKKSDAGALKKTTKNYREAMELVLKIWPEVVEELGIEVTSATANAYSAGYCEAAKECGLPENLACLRGDHVASKTLYKVSRWFPFK